MAPKKASISPADVLPALLHRAGGSFRATKQSIEAEKGSEVEVIDEGSAVVLRLHRAAKS